MAEHACSQLRRGKTVEYVVHAAVQQADEITFQVGSGIVVDSIPEKEHEETLHKAAGILAAAS